MDDDDQEHDDAKDGVTEPSPEELPPGITGVVGAGGLGPLAPIPPEEVT